MGDAQLDAAVRRVLKRGPDWKRVLRTAVRQKYVGPTLAEVVREERRRSNRRLVKDDQRATLREMWERTYLGRPFFTAFRQAFSTKDQRMITALLHKAQQIAQRGDFPRASVAIIEAQEALAQDVKSSRETGENGRVGA